MEIAEVSIYVSSIVLLIIYILIEKRNSYRKGFNDGVEYYSHTVEKLLDHINQWNKKAKDAGMDLAAYVESIKAESEETDETEVYDYSTHSYRRGCRYSDRTERSDKNGTNNYSTKY